MSTGGGEAVDVAVPRHDYEVHLQVQHHCVVQQIDSQLQVRRSDRPVRYDRKVSGRRHLECSHSDRRQTRGAR